MNFNVIDLIPAAAEIWMLAMACVVLVADVFVKDRARTATFALTVLTLQ